jgi:hypothetical protein
MCKQKGNSFCSELGRDVSLWSKECPLPKPEWLHTELEFFNNVIDLAFDGKVEAARLILKESRDLDMRSWFDTHAQNIGAWRAKAFNVESPKAIVPLDELKNFAKFETSLFARDNFRCGYCSCEIFPKKLFKKVQKIVGESYLPLGRTNATRSGFYLLYVGTLDHVLPWSLGGRTDERNLVTCCWSCNYGKANFTVEQIGIRNPLVKF